MESRVHYLFQLKRSLLHRVMVIVAACLLGAVPLSAAEQQETPAAEAPLLNPEVERTPFKESKIDTENVEVGVFTGLLSVEDFGTNGVLGARLAYHVTERVFVEAAYGMADTQKSSYERLSGAAQLLTEEQRKLTYYNLSLGYNLLPSEVFATKKRTFNSDLYLVGGVGTTTFAGDDHFTLHYGAGYRLLLTDWLAVHGDVRDFMFETDLLGQKKSTHNLEMSLGLTLFF